MSFRGMSVTYLARATGTACVTKDTMDMSMDKFTRGEVLDFDSFDNTLDYIPTHLHPQVFKSFYRGYQAVFTAIYNVLNNPTITLPSLERISSAVSLSDASFYFGKGGQVVYALDCVIDVAREQSAVGDGEFESLYEAEYLAMPACANDLEFGVVRNMMGLEPEKVWGPYRGDGDGEDDGELARRGLTREMVAQVLSTYQARTQMQ